MKKSTLIAAITALSMAGVMLLAAPAHATVGNQTNWDLTCDSDSNSAAGESTDLKTSTVDFEDICLTSGEIGEAGTRHTSDAYDGYGLIGTTDAVGDEYFFTADSSENDGSTFSFTDTDVYNYLTDGFVNVHVVRTFVGNTVTWTVDVVDAESGDPEILPLFISGDLGSDSSTEFTQYASYLMSMDNRDSDPYLLWKSTGDASYVNGSDRPVFDFGMTSTATLQNIIIGYSECADEADVSALLQSIDADWAAYANTDITEVGACFDMVGTTTFTRGAAVDTILTFDGHDNFDWRWGGSAEIGALPAGLDAEVLNVWSDDETPPTLHIYGTPTTAGATDSVVYLEDDDMDAEITITLTVVNEPVAADLSLHALVGELVAGSDVAYSASGLQQGAAWTLTARSTPQVIAQGTVPVSGSISGVATIPANLEAGWHTLTLESTDNTGAALTRVVYFEIGSNGQLLSSNYTGIPAVEAAVDNVEPIVEAELAATGFSGGNGALGALALALAGTLLLGAAVRRRNMTHTV